MTEWQPIETAPKDHKPVLLRARYPNGYGESDIIYGWCQGDCWARWYHTFPPSHWIPDIPLPKKQQK